MSETAAFSVCTKIPVASCGESTLIVRDSGTFLPKRVQLSVRDSGVFFDEANTDFFREFLVFLGKCIQLFFWAVFR